jgi:uncharacterized RDD family membrane protein YckC
LQSPLALPCFGYASEISSPLGTRTAECGCIARVQAMMPPPPPGTIGEYAAPVPGGRLATMGARFGALVIDSIIILIITTTVGLAAVGFKWNHNTPCTQFAMCTASQHHHFQFGTAAIYLLVSAAYYGYLAGVRTQTPGHQLANIRVVDVATENPIGLWRGIVRALVLTLSADLCTLGYWSPFFDATRRQGWHDKAARSVVIPSARR